ncbi:acyl-CoA dehydrogenase family protein [Desulfosporosinus orientis]|uniref:acyl-CoA dehydrogenase family protein n=1 Tax=Desulfosporosinus orientis TaxID=1563 RepID=UPI000304EB1B|nr:acyl-CoA dehydrogenase family protein [Desulfosporosinus orientis]
MGKFCLAGFIYGLGFGAVQRAVPREIWKKFGDYGYLCTDVDEEYGGAGVD